ncbi:MAG: PAS domain S-box protein [Crocinitomicaceae bacterium]|nr:PAS domain S-box protein [Crocinitomicaceae bacterium]
MILFYTLSISVTGVFSLFLQQKALKSVLNFNTYLKKVSQGNKFGFFIFSINDKKINIVDFDDEFSLSILGENKGKSKEELSELFNTFITPVQIDKILALSDTDFISQLVTINDKSLEFSFSRLKLNRIDYYLIKVNDVSDIFIKQEELKASEEKYRNLYNESQAGVFTLNNSFTIINLNHTFYNIFNREFQIGSVFIKNNEDRTEILEVLKEEGKLINYQTHITLNDNTIKWVVISFFYDFNKQLIEGSIIDISEIQKINNELRQSEEKFKLIFEDSNDAIVILDENKVIEVNRRAIQLFGISKAEFSDIDFWNLTMDLNDELKNKLKIYLNKLKFSRSVKFTWTFEGRFEPIEAEVAIVELVIGKHRNYQCIIHDVTDKNKAFRAIEKSTKNFQSVLESTPEGILIVKDKSILYANKEAYSLINSVTIDINDLFTKNDQKVFNLLLNDNYPTKYQDQLHLKSGNLEIPVTITIVNTTFGASEALLIMFKDVSLEMKLSKEILRAELAEETNKSLAKEIKERIKAEKITQNLLLKTQAIFDSSANIILLTCDLNKKITYYNKHSQLFFKQFIKQKLKLGITINEFFKDFYTLPKYTGEELTIFNYLFEKVKKGKFRQFEFEIKKGTKNWWIEVFMNPIYDTEGNVTEVSLMSHDITLKKKIEKDTIESLHEKEILLKEIHHRVKNNLQVISSILNLQSSFVTDSNTLNVLKESRNRIRSMAIIHENLYQTKNFSSIDFNEYIKNLVLNIESLYHIDDKEILIEFDLDITNLSLDQAVPSGLIMNELITNAFKYAFVGKTNNILKIGIKNNNDVIQFIVKDNGVGLPPNIVIDNLDSLGLQLVVTLCDQLDATFEFKVDNGTEFLITFKKI